MEYEIVVIGTSLGGLNALAEMLSTLPDNFRLPIAVVQHRGKDPDAGICQLLRRHTTLPVSEAEDKEEIKAGQIYLAPPNYHLLVERGAFALSTEAPVFFARPSIDVLFETAASAYGRRLIGVILTGASADGALGAQRIKDYGGLLIAQDPATAECGVMPAAAIEKAQIDQILPLKEIIPYIISITYTRSFNELQSDQRARA